MAGYVESEAVFRQRAREVGLSTIQLDALCTAGFSTIGRYAYSCSFVPGSPDDKPLLDMVSGALGADPGPGPMALFRRLFFEAFTLVTADLKLRLERSDDGPVRRLAVPERASRYDIQQLKLQGLVLRGELECSDGLIDLAISQFDDNRLRYIKWSQCLKKEAEMDGVRKDASIVPNQQGQLQLTSVDSSPDADTSTELLLRFALSRRGLAYDQANVLEYANHELWVTKLFTLRLRSAPAGHNRVTLDQLLTADRALFVRLAELTRAGIVPAANGIRPLDVVFQATMVEQEIVQLLMQLPGTSSSSSKRALENADDTPPWQGDGKNKKRKGSPGKSGGKGGKSGKGAKNGKSQSQPPSLPAGLEGSSRTPEGSHICFSYNFGKCDPKSSGCNKGKHVCTKCFGSHPFAEHK
jgi:hypothetical protein